jgi:hypothetical protein
MEKISRWMKNCSKQHRLCAQASQPPQLPSRVLEIISPETLRLHVAQPSEVANYACLSHCWGDTQLIQTTTTSLDAHTKNIPWAELPKTFQHAVHVTAKLSLRYLWIDSLCIVQNDKEDWRHEGSKMAQIYMNSYITIAATASKDSSQGLFRVHGHEHAPKTHQLQGQNLLKYDVHVRKPLPHFNNKSMRTKGEQDYFPLLQRGWVHQERLLSPRVVHFGPEEVLWECLNTTTCECQCWPMNNNETKTGTMDIALLSHKEGLYSAFRKHEVNEQWCQIVSQYSQMKLTFERDIFPALQGIAGAFSRVKECAYYAGLWEDSLILDLTWSSSRKNPGVRPQTWRAPSWSWASIVGEVFYWNSYLRKPCVTVLSVEVTPVGSDPFGEITSASLTLAGFALSVTLVYDSEVEFSIYYTRVMKKENCLQS